jgi:annexin D
LLQKAILLWLPDPATRDAMILRQSLSGDRIDLTAATEIICSRTPTQIQTIKQIYNSRFGAYLEHDVTLHTSGDHQKVHCFCFPEFLVDFFFSYLDW